MTTQNSYNNIYIGPAAQCPCPPIDEKLLIISGDHGRNAESIINNNSQSKIQKDYLKPHHVSYAPNGQIFIFIAQYAKIIIFA